MKSNVNGLYDFLLLRISLNLTYFNQGTILLRQESEKKRREDLITKGLANEAVIKDQLSLRSLDRSNLYEVGSYFP